MEIINTMIDAFKIPFLTAILTILAIFLKEHFTLKRERKKEKQSKIETFKIYSRPILNSATSIFWRLKEIFEKRNSYLLEKSPKNKYNSYKYISTIYRLLAIIGWIRAIEKELSYIKYTNSEKDKEIDEVIKKFKSSLADGEHIEKDRISYISKHWDIDLSKYSQLIVDNLGMELEKLTWSFLDKNKKENPMHLNETLKKELVFQIENLFSKELGIASIDKGIIDESISKVIKEISRVEAWIYRDWQQALGDMMLVKDTISTRRFDIMGFMEFEQIFKEKEKNSKYIWISRIEQMLKDLDLSKDNRFDARIIQLQNICSACLGVIEAFNQLENIQTIDKKVIATMKDFDMKNNYKFYN